MKKEARLHSIGKFFQQMVMGNWKATCKKKNEIRSFFNSYTKINSKWIKDLNMRPDSIKLLEENISRTLSDINHNNIFFNSSLRIMEIKEKINKWDLFKYKSFCTEKEIIKKKKTERLLTYWEKIFANVINNRLASKIYKLLRTQHQNNPYKNWAGDLNRHFSKEDI